MPGEPTRHRPDDQTLALRAQGGCVDSFEELLRRHQVPLLHFLKRFANETEAEDILQETFIRAYRNLDRYRARWSFSTWLFTIARRLAANSRKRQKPGDDNTTEIESLPSGSPGPEAALAAEENKQKLWDIAAAVLTPDQHTALWLYYVEDMPVKEIAAVLGRFVPATKMMLHRARQKLTPALQATDLNHE
ncbi:MAG: sigma-70 family RNA polymerase sigma factor [Planctomycetota bacterium]|nr:sigma-70 family RNA polymerase sigma factor [Planctomycetota bacterium]